MLKKIKKMKLSLFLLIIGLIASSAAGSSEVINSQVSEDAGYFNNNYSLPWSALTQTGEVSSSSSYNVRWMVKDKEKQQIIFAKEAAEISRLEGNFYIADVKKSDTALKVTGNFKHYQDKLLFTGNLNELGLIFEVIFVPHDNFMEVMGRVKDNTNQDRAVNLMYSLDIEALGWDWWDDIRNKRRIEAEEEKYAYTTSVFVGQTGEMSCYPFSCISSEKQAFSYGVPLNRPRVFNIYYDTKTKKYNISFDLALSGKTEKFPNEADFYFILYSPDSQWAFRDAAMMYYNIYPSFFEKRVEREGIWMPFTAVNSVENEEDFNFMFHEFNVVDLEYNNTHGIYSFRYLEPWTYWMALETNAPRQYNTVVERLENDVVFNDTLRRKMAQSTLLSGMYDREGKILHEFLNRPWCNGVVFFNNADPDIKKKDMLEYNQADISFEIAKRNVVDRKISVFESWDNYAEGYEMDEANLHLGLSSLKLANYEADREFGAKQVVVLEQTQARPLIFGGYSKAMNVSGKKDADYSIYVDLLNDDGTYSWGYTVSFDPGTHDWQYNQGFIYPEKPIKMAMLHILFRGKHTGEVWFDDVFCKELTDEEIKKTGKQEWDKYIDGFELDLEVKHSGTKAVFVNKIEPSGTYGARQRIDLNQKRAIPIKISGWSRAEDVKGAVDSDYSLYADITYADGTPLYGMVKNFDAATHDWQLQELILEPERPIKTVMLHLLFRGNHTGKVWFDDISVIDTMTGEEFVHDGSFEKMLTGTPEEVGKNTVNLVKNGDFEKGSSGLIIDGIYLDSLEGWAKEKNFRQEHFKYADIPLTYDTRTKEPVILNAFSIYEFTKAMCDYMKESSRFLMANWVTIDFPFYAPLLDAAGKEVHWLGWEDAYQPDTDEAMNYRRTLSFQKPYLLLLNVHFDRFTFDMMDKYFQRSLFYGMFPSMFSFDAASDPYFENPNYYNRDRELFIKYMPILKKISQAGWQPVTFAKSSNENIFIERYGKDYTQDLHFTVHNNLDFNQKADIKFDKKSLALNEAVVLSEVISNVDIDYNVEGDYFVVPVSMSGYQTMVFRVIKDDFTTLSKIAVEDLIDLESILKKYAQQNKITAQELTQYSQAIDLIVKEVSSREFVNDIEDIEKKLSELTNLAVEKKQAELSSQVLRSENSISKLQANVLKVSLDFKGLNALVSPSKGRCAITISNDGQGNIMMDEIHLAFSSNLKINNVIVPLSKEIVPAGASVNKDIVFNVPEGLLEGTEGMVNIKAAYSSDGKKISLVKARLLYVVRDIDFKLEPLKLRTFNTNPEFKALIHNNCNVPVKGALTVTAPSECQPSLSKEDIEIAAGETECVIFDILCPDNDSRQDFEFKVSFIVDGKEKNSQQGLISVFPKTDSLLLEPGVSIKVDSIFPGYTTKPINDGIIDTEGFVWNESACASAEISTPHWVEITFPKPVSISSVVIHWGEDQGKYFVSNQYKIEYWKDEDWSLLAEIKAPNTAEKFNKHTFNPAVTDKIRIWQDYSGGSEARPDLLWLREVEVFQ